jgi:hypothetical protein
MFVRTAAWAAFKSAGALWTALWGLKEIAPRVAEFEPGSPGATIATIAGDYATYLLHVAMYYPDGVILAHTAAGMFWAFMLEGPVQLERDRLRRVADDLRKKRR